jgi:hypothetical protein
VLLPRAVANAVCRRGIQFDLQEGGRFEVLLDCDPTGRVVVIRLWSGLRGRDGRSVAPVGEIELRWPEPGEEHAAVTELRWWPGRGGTEAEVRRALDVLVGEPVAFG